MNIINDKPNAKDYERLYKSNQYGNFKIIKDLGIINKAHMVLIKFIDTGYESKVQLNQVKYGQVRDALRFPINEEDGYGTKIYHSNNFGDYIIVKDINKKDIHDLNRRCIIKFINTGSEREVGYAEAINGNVKDYYYGIDYNKIYHSCKSGDFKIVEYLGSMHKGRYVIIEFLNTNNRMVARLDHAEEGNVLDHSIIKFFRPGITSTNASKDYYKFYKRWDSMIRRCFNSNDPRYKNYKDVAVCDRWMYFSNYLQDIINIPGYYKAINNLNNYHIDKDLIPMLNNIDYKIYSPNTCIWLDKCDNVTIRRIVPHMLSYGCNIIPLQNGDFEGIIVINGIIIEHNIYPTINSMYNKFMHYITPKTMCEIINK